MKEQNRAWIEAQLKKAPKLTPAKRRRMVFLLKSEPVRR